MIDTLMVLWTSGLWKSFLRTTGLFLFLCASICALLLLIVTGDVNQAGLAVTVAATGKEHASLTAQGVPAPSTMPTPTTMPTIRPYVIPVILQNPLVVSPTVTPRRTPVLHATPRVEQIGRQPYPIYRRAPSPVPTSPPVPSSTAPAGSGLPDPSNIFSTLP